MPTPDMKGKEIIYWILIRTQDKRLATDLGRFMDGAPKFIDLRVPSALIAARTEIETFRQVPPKGLAFADVQPGGKSKTGEVISEKGAEQNSNEDNSLRFEIILRRTLPTSSEKQTQSPYG